jgi:adenylate kinase family enzyme
MNKPELIIIAGKPASGKSTLAHILAKEIRCPLISRDEIKEGYINTVKIEHNKIEKEENINVNDTFFNTIELLLDKKITIIAEAAFQNKFWKPKYDLLEKKANIKIIICITDSELSYKRYLERKNKDPIREYFHGEATIFTGNFLYEYIKFPVPTLEVDTTNGYNPDLNEIKIFINNEKE